MQTPTPSETPEHQEQRARAYMRPKAAVITGLILGTYFLVFSRGWPWLGTSFFDAVIGRVTGLGWYANLPIQYVVAVAYALAIGFVVFRLPVLAAAFAGILTGGVLYGINFAIATVMGGVNPGEDTGVLLGHLFFGLFGSLIYKAFSVPPPKA